MYQEINSYELKKILENEKVNLIDIRERNLYDIGTIVGARNISINCLIESPERYLNKDEYYYIFCNYGNNSKRLCDYLSRFGYKVINIIDGYQGYLDSI